MPRNVYSEINLHFVRHTKESRFPIKPEMEQTVYDHGTKNLRWIKHYIRDQKRHHDQETWEERLERITERQP